VDLDPNSVSSVWSVSLGHMFGPHNLLSSQGGAGSNWARGHNTVGAEFVDPVMEALR
jgi:tubulin beta